MSDDPFKNSPSGLESPAAVHYEVIPGSSVLNPRPRALVALTDGTVTIEDREAMSATYPLMAGQVFPFRAYKITAATATIMAWL